MTAILTAAEQAGTWLGRVHDPACGGPLVVTLRDGMVTDITARGARDRGRHLRPARPRRPCPRGAGPRAGPAGGLCRAAGGRHSPAGALRPAGGQGLRRDLCPQHGGARDRGEIRRRPRPRRRDPRPGGQHHRRQPAQPARRVGRGGPREGDPDRRRAVVAIPGGRDRPGCRGLHQGAGHGLGRLGGRCRPAPDQPLEQPRARGGAGGGAPWPDRRRDTGQRREPARCRGALGAAAWQGQGQQRLVRHRAADPAVRRRLVAG